MTDFMAELAQAMLDGDYRDICDTLFLPGTPPPFSATLEVPQEEEEEEEVIDNGVVGIRFIGCSTSDDPIEELENHWDTKPGDTERDELLRCACAYWRNKFGETPSFKDMELAIEIYTEAVEQSQADRTYQTAAAVHRGEVPPTPVPVKTKAPQLPSRLQRELAFNNAGPKMTEITGRRRRLFGDAVILTVDSDSD